MKYSTAMLNKTAFLLLKQTSKHKLLRTVIFATFIAFFNLFSFGILTLQYYRSFISNFSFETDPNDV